MRVMSSDEIWIMHNDLFKLIGDDEMSVLSREIVNKGRQLELDFARGIAVLFMVLIHMQEYFLTQSASEKTMGLLIDFAGGMPAAPVFMVLMGVGFVYSRKSTPGTLFKRGIIIFFVGYALNLARGVMPSMYQYLLYGAHESLELAIEQLMYVDIFQFSGLAMIFFSFVKKINLHWVGLVLFLGIFAGFNVYVSDVAVNSTLLKSVTGLFWGSNDTSFFPFLTWIFYPIIGYLFGQVLIRVQKKNWFYVGLFIANVMLYGIFIYAANYLQYDLMLFSEEGYYHHQWIENIVATCFVFAWLSGIYLVSPLLKIMVKKPLVRWSTNVSEIYFIHWILIGWFVPFFGYNTLTEPYFYLLLAMLFVISDALAEYVNLRKRVIS